MLKPLQEGIPITSRIDRYRSNWCMYISSAEISNDEEILYSAGEYFSGQIHQEIDGLDPKDKQNLLTVLESIANANTLEEAEAIMEDEGIVWNCVGDDLR